LLPYISSKACRSPAAIGSSSDSVTGGGKKLLVVTGRHKFRAFADCQSAIQPITNRRYVQ
jgi:hypothetical protein